jgi:hypothetical protein
MLAKSTHRAVAVQEELLVLKKDLNRVSRPPVDSSRNLLAGLVPEEITHIAAPKEGLAFFDFLGAEGAQPSIDSFALLIRERKWSGCHESASRHALYSAEKNKPLGCRLFRLAARQAGSIWVNQNPDINLWRF